VPCLRCAHFQARAGERWRCAAFPDGIPQDIALLRVRHDTPYPGDNGVLFEAAPVDTDAEFTFDEPMP
jgi:hypothetical protein